MDLRKLKKSVEESKTQNEVNKKELQNIHHWSGVTTSMRRVIRISCSASLVDWNIGGTKAYPHSSSLPTSLPLC